MRETWLEARNLSVAFEGLKALDGFSCCAGPGEVVGLIGSNGAGKTTFFNAVTGFVTPQLGEVEFRGVNLLGLPPHRRARTGIARTFQELRLFRRLTVLDNAMLVCRGNPGERPLSAFRRSKASSDYEVAKREAVLATLNEVGLAEKASETANDLSYGQQKLLSLAGCLLSGADLLLLDEPVAGLAPEVIEKVLQLVGRIRLEGKCVVMIEHNIEAIMKVCDRVLFMDTGRLACEGSPEEVRADPRVMDAYLGARV